MMRYRLNRRGFLSLPMVPALVAATASAADEKQLTFTAQGMPASLDPIATPSFATCTAAMAVFETLYGTDAKLNPMPQMVERFKMEDDGGTWTFQLRSGLSFHDGSKVTARDCVASLRRWMRRDRVGHALGQRMDVIEAPDDATLRLRLAKPLLKVPLMLAKSQLSPPVIMPARFADSGTDTPVDGVIGSGPFRLSGLAWHAGEPLDLMRFEHYQPRKEASSFTGGGRVAMLDRIRWQVQNDPMKALRDGVADWVEWLPPDTVGDGDVATGRLNEIGYYAMLRLNALRGPTANQRVRQAILAGIDQTGVMAAVFGGDTSRFRAPIGLFPHGSEFVNNMGSDRFGGTKSPRAIKAMLADASYKSEPIVVLNPIDDMIHGPLTTAVIDQLTLIGLTVEERKLDRAAFAAWKLTSARSDWAAFCDSVPCADHYDCFAISAGPPPAGGLWPGWPDDPAATRLRDSWIDAADLPSQRAIAGQLQMQVFTTAAFVPLGQWFPTAGWRKTVTGLQKGSFPVFWDVARS